MLFNNTKNYELKIKQEFFIMIFLTSLVKVIFNCDNSMLDYFIS